MHTLSCVHVHRKVPSLKICKSWLRAGVLSPALIKDGSSDHVRANVSASCVLGAAGSALVRDGDRDAAARDAAHKIVKTRPDLIMASRFLYQR
jgi:hypothetical protein